ncbi:hypothetical protein C2845_PM01G49160 [Panicum miliaceum]|uniref:Uncharacterized protein n=1 Tax=Panicum miliaceum TaxID=4540 RepID=A0A3L6TIG9_PANMI|nr:hypothetical protein C2845_PM01G49160 [Panicum miliaceum]
MEEDSTSINGGPRFCVALFQSGCSNVMLCSSQEKCAKSGLNRANVKLHGCTGSRSNIAAAYAEDDMEALLTRPVQEGELEKTCTEIVSQVLPKSSTFLRNVGLQQTVATPNSIPPQMRELRAQLEAEKEESAGLWQKLQRLEAQAEESEAKSQKQAEEIDILKKATVDTQNLVQQMIAFGQSQATHQTTP